MGAVNACANFVVEAEDALAVGTGRVGEHHRFGNLCEGIACGWVLVFEGDVTLNVIAETVLVRVDARECALASCSWVRGKPFVVG